MTQAKCFPTVITSRVFQWPPWEVSLYERFNSLYVFRLGPSISCLLPSPPTTSSCGSPAWCRWKTATVRPPDERQMTTVYHDTWMREIAFSFIILVLVNTDMFLMLSVLSGRLPAAFWDQCWAERSDAGRQCDAHQQCAPEIPDATLRGRKCQSANTFLSHSGPDCHESFSQAAATSTEV